MRLVCPSCAAEYEIMSAAIGAKGRMVRCASCAHEWFQGPEADVQSVAPPIPVATIRETTPPKSDPVPIEEVDVDLPASEPEVIADVTPEPEPAPKAEPKPEPVAKRADEPMAEPVAERPKSVISDAMIESDLSDAPAPVEIEPAVASLASVAMPSFEEPTARKIDQPPKDRIHFDEDTIPAHQDLSDESSIKSRAAPEPEGLSASMRATEADTAGGSSGGAFLAGFATVTVIALLAIAAYVKAPEIVDMVPGAKAPLTAYSALVDSGRLALAQAVGG